MTKAELMNRIVENHNRIAKMLVSADNAILVGDTIKDLRLLLQQLQSESIEEPIKDNSSNN
jgi:hypothetical protein